MVNNKLTLKSITNAARETIRRMNCVKQKTCEPFTFLAILV